MKRFLAAATILFACGDEVEPAASDAGASCRMRFGDAPEYRDCGGDADGCAFHTAGAYRTCGGICDQLGSTCEAAYRTESGCERLSGDLGCEHPSNEIICVCLRPSELGNFRARDDRRHARGATEVAEPTSLSD